MLEFFKKIYTVCANFVLSTYEKVKAWLSSIEWLDGFYQKVKGIWPFEDKFKFEYVTIILVALIVILIFALIFGGISRGKKRKVRFYVDGKLYAVTKTKLKRAIVMPEEPAKEGYEFAGWFVDKKFKKKPKAKLKKKKLKLYAKFNKVEDTAVNEVPTAVEAVNTVEVAPVIGNQVANEVVETEVPAIDNVTACEEVSVEENTQVERGVIEEVIEISQVSLLGSLYDDIRFEMLGYERASSFKKMGVVRKHIIAEMFEKDEQIYLYLAANPQLMLQKGFNVETYTQQEFAIVPCKKVIKTVEDAEDAKKLIKEVMTLNHLVKSEIVCAKKTVSDEQTRKNGFAFYVKNDLVVTTSTDYYKMLRAIVLSYSASKTRKLPSGVDNKMILKIFKKDEKVFLYLSLDADKEGLEFVGYDKNFIDTPAMFEIKTAEDCLKANELIDKLMYVYGMDKNPEQAEISLEDNVETNCGFGYRIRR